MFLVTAEEIQKMDREAIESFGIPGQVLMENAGRGAFNMLTDLFCDIISKKVCIVAGRGNNGGDGFVIARYLMEMGVKTKIILLSTEDKVHGDARANLILLKKLEKEFCTKCIIEIPDKDFFLKQKPLILHHDIFVDAILGTGLKSNVKGLFKDVIETLNSTGKPIFSVDIPSGLNSDTGEECGVSIKAFATATFAFAKVGQILHPGDKFTGILKTIDIGIPNFIVHKKRPLIHLTEKKEIRSLFPPRESETHKGSFGHLFIIAGSAGKTGAAALCANAAMRCGTGLVTLGIPESLNIAVEPQVCEAMTLPLPEKEKGCLSELCFKAIKKAAVQKNAIALGPGMGTEQGTGELIKKIIREIDIPLIMDADALNCIADTPDILKEKKASVIVTPHPGEMARLCKKSVKEIQKNRIESAKNFAKEFDVVVILKGSKTITALPDGRIFINPTGNPGMASGGMGDVLTGMTAGLTAQGFSLKNAAIAGVYIHGLCGDILAEKKGPFGFLASDMVKTIPRAIYTGLK
ncbi:MAG: NAD(P)H-hydrate dehydratase [Thermodesulfobacteriota bacterium]|nr:NAD(P)H-hydrate dehydratase [Thermodesulfobacteriota bacterium]